MSEYSDVANLRFIENTDPDQINNAANIQWTIVDDPTRVPGWAWTPYSGWGGDLSGVIQINRAYYDETTSQSFQPGGYNYLVYTHEFGHALGFKHPHEESTLNTTYYPTFPGVEPDSPQQGGDHGLNATPWTVATYNNWEANEYAPSLTDTKGYLTGLGAFDIAAIQYLYGPNNSNKTGDDTYSLDLNLNGFQSIWDAAGNDTIDASSSTGSVTIDLRNATLENEPGGGGFVSQVDGQLKGYTIAYNSTGNAVIENAKGSAYTDYLRGNSANNTLDGQAGFDTAAFSGNIGEYNLSLDGSTGAFQVADNSSSRDGTDQLFNVERINFNGSTYDFPTDITLSALNIDEQNPVSTKAWAKIAGGSNSNDISTHVTSLSDGSSIVTGIFQSTASFGGTTLSSAGSYDGFITKLNADGEYQWTTQAGSSGTFYLNNISSLINGSSIVTGVFQGNASFGDIKLTSAGDTDAFIAKLNPDGEYQWAIKSGGRYSDTGHAITSLNDGSSIVTGYFTGSANFGDTTLSSAGDTDTYIAKLNADGEYQWATKAGGSESDRSHAITSLSDGSSIVAGVFRGTASFGDTTLSSAGSDDGFITKLNADGEYQWATQVGGNNDERTTGLASLSDGSSIVSGYFEKTASFGDITLTSAGDRDAFIAKLNSDGEYQWVTQAGGSNRDTSTKITSLSDGSSIVSGYFEKTASFGDIALTSAGDRDAFIAKLNSDGEYQWVTQAGGSDYDNAQAISSLRDGSSIVTGFFGPFDQEAYVDNGWSWEIDENTGYANFGDTTLTSTGGTDVFIAKLNANGLWSSISFNENLAAGTAIASLSATDPDSGNNHSFSFLSGAGSQDNSFFSISGNQLVINESADFEAKDSYSVRLQATDAEGLAVAKSFAIGVNDLDDQKTYSLTTSANQVNEGQVLTSTISTSYVDPGTTVYWQLSGNNITEDDLEAGELEGSAQVNDQGRASFTNTLKLDRKTEGNENLQVKIFADSARTIQVANTASVAINDTSIDPTYTLSTSASQVDEGQELTTTITTTEVGPGTTLYWQLSGNNITANDLEDGALEGSAQVDSQGKASFSLKFTEDRKTEGNENIEISLFNNAERTRNVGETTTIEIKDTSIDLVKKNPNLVDSYPGKTFKETRNSGAFAAIKEDGSVVTWGVAESGGDSSAVASQLQRGVSQIFSNKNAFAALKVDGSVVTWGLGSESSETQSALKSGKLAGGVENIYSTKDSFAALKSDGSVITWGASNSGGNSDNVKNQLTNGVSKIFSTDSAFAALKDDGSVVVWGNDYVTFHRSNGDGNGSSGLNETLKEGVRQIFTTMDSFAALKEDGSIVSWGSIDIPLYHESEYDHFDGNWPKNSNNSYREFNNRPVKQIVSNSEAFALLTEDGEVITWGDTFGGASRYPVCNGNILSGVKKLFSSSHGFTALKENGGTVSWGYDSSPSNGAGNYEWWYGGTAASGDVKDIASTNGAFAILKEDGSVATWGKDSEGGDSSKVANQLNNEVDRIFSTNGAFAALKNDGSVVTWGDVNRGADSSSVLADIGGKVSTIFTTDEAFAALKNDGSVVSWGGAGGDSSLVSSQLASEVVSMANIFTDDVYSPPSPTYSLTSSKETLQEGELLTTTVNTTNLPSGTPIYWSLVGEDGANITEDDISSGELDGTEYLDSEGNATITHEIANDRESEGVEQLRVKIFSDSQRYYEVVESASIAIQDTSLDPTYTLSTTANLVDEGQQLTTTITTTEVDPGSTLYWQLSGNNITADDLEAGELEGSAQVDDQGRASFDHTLANDRKTEGNEGLKVKLFTDSARMIQVGNTASVEINDTSLDPAYTLSNTANQDIFLRGESLYTMLNGSKWTDAEREANKLGGYLASINSEEENQFLIDNNLVDAWIGINDKETEGKFVWSSGEDVVYTNWSKSNPNNASGVQDYGHMKKDGTWDDRYWTEWLDYGHIVKINKGLVEIPFIRGGHSAYLVVDGPSWEQAEANAVRLGGHLVTINNSVENQWISKNIGVEKWIGLNDKEREGDFVWSSGEDLTYTNWAAGEPSNSTESEYYGFMKSGQNGEWDDLQNDPNVKQGIVEIKLSADSFSPTYSLNTSTNSLNEGQSLTTNITATDVDLGTELFWALDGNNITQEDLIAGQITGSNQVGADGNFSFSHTFAEDLTTEGKENLQINLFTDQSRTEQVGNTATIEIEDTSKTPAYHLFTSTESIDEGEQLTTYVSTEHVDAATEFFWSLSGSNITEEDLSDGQLEGSSVIDSEGNFSFKHTIAKDRITEGNENLEVKLFSDSLRANPVGNIATVEINDTSQTPTYSLTASSIELDEGQSLTTNISTTHVDEGTELFWSLTGNNISQSDLAQGQLTGSAQVDAEGSFVVEHTIANDVKKEGKESLVVKLFTDSHRNKQVAETPSIDINDTSAPSTYELTTSSQEIEEGDVLTTTVSTTYVEEGTELHWSLTGENINQEDLAEGQLQGSGQVDSEGKFSFSHTLAKDAKTEGDETLGIKLFTDSAHNQPVAGTTWGGVVADVQIRDTSQPPIYELTTSSSAIEEGQLLTTNVSTGFVEPGTELHWSLSGTGINQGDFKEGDLSGSGQTDADGKFSFSHTLRNDQTREGPENLEIKLFNDALRSEQVGNTASVEIKDTSMSTHYVRRGDSAYVVVEGPSWQEAEAYAQSIGGNLVTINDEAENEWLLNAFKGEPSNSLHIGLKENSNDDDHEWASGDTSLYRNWEAGEPNGLNDGNADQTAEFYLNSGRWNDHPNVETKGIAEISLARSNPNIAQSWEPPLAKQWTRLLGGSLQSRFDSVVTGGDGSIYIGGDKSVNDSNWSDALITKYDSDGSTDWTRLLGSNKDERSHGISAASDGTIYIAGYTSGDLDEQINSGGTTDVFLAKYDADGNKAWSDIFGSSLLEYAFGVTTTNDGSIYIAGETWGDLDGQLNSGSSDAFLSKYDVDGTRKWTRLLGSHGSSEAGWSGIDSARAITSASDGSIYITGYTSGDLDGQNVKGDGSNGQDAFLAKYDTKGNRIWTKQWGSSGSDYGRAITTDIEGSIYIAGSTTGDLDGISNQSTYDVEDAFVSKFDSNGEKQWTRLLGSTGKDQANAITTDSEGSIYIAGITNGSLDGNTNNNSPRSGGHDSFLSKYDAAGNKQWTQLFGSSRDDWAKAITTGSDGSIYIAGMTNGDLDGNYTGSGSGFLTKYAPAYSLTPDSDLELSYSLHTTNGTSSQTDLKQLAVLGDSVDWQDTYRLDITAKSLAEGYDLETADITINFDPYLFNEIKASDITIGGQLPIANAVRIDNDVGTIRIAAASLGDLDPGQLYGVDPSGAGESIGADGAVLASIELDFNEFRLDTLTQNSNGKILDPSTPLFFGLSANQDETVFSKALDDGSGLANREIKSLRDLGGDLAVDGTKVTLYEAAINLEEQGDGLILSTERVIGSYNPISTNLVRSGATISTTSTWTNVGNIEAQNIQVTGITNSNAQLLEDQSYFAYKGIGANGDQLTRNSLNNLKSGRFSSDTGEFDSTAQESGELHAAIKITGAAGNVVDLGLGIASLQADGSDLFSNQKGSKNLITYQGDLNYDGRVSMKDLAYLNAGAARQQQVSAADNATEVDANNDGVVDASVATAVDANFDGQISMADLAVLDADWGESLHQPSTATANGSESSFTGSNQISWDELDNQGTTGDAAWDNQAFKDQNAVEAANDFVESLESPAAVGVIGMNGNTINNDVPEGGKGDPQDESLTL
ncbi:lectin-like protein [Prochlorococcus sp. MIT 1227]|uniref:lectin-like protein n=2 Tax=unclassified Prochlorococcus TaxID=2627481 RepID=UPI0039A6AB66